MPVRFLVVLLSLAALLLGGCGLTKADPPSIGSLTVTDRVEEPTKAPGTPLTTFPSQSTHFYASVQVLNPAKKTRVMARWYFDQKLIDEYEVTFERPGDRYVAFKLQSETAKPFPPGSYKVEILLDGKLVEQKSFQVQ